MSKESLTEPGGGGGGMKRTPSRESLKGSGSAGGGVKEVIQAPGKEGGSMTAGGGSMGALPGTGGGVSVRELNKENRERSAPSKDTQSSAEGSVENMQASLFQQVIVHCL